MNHNTALVHDPPATLVLVCADAGRLAPGLVLAELAERVSARAFNTQVVVAESLCARLAAMKHAVELAGARRLVLALCSDGTPRPEVDSLARKARLDPFGVQIVLFNALKEAPPCSVQDTAVLLLTAAVARAQAFRGSRPENWKAVVARDSHIVSRRSLFTLPPVTYAAVPTINREFCAADAGCDLCITACPGKALAQTGGRVQVNLSACSSCGMCVSVCPKRAVELPGWSPEEMEAQMAVYLAANGDQAAHGLLFVCNNATQQPPASWLPVTTPCTATAPAAALLHALARGAAAVSVAPCTGACPFNVGDQIQGTIDYCQRLLEAMGENPQRVGLYHPGAAAPLPPMLGVGAGDGGIDEPQALFGSGAAAQAVLSLALRLGASDAAIVLEHTHSPLGVVVIDPESCTGCGSCARMCPTGALAFEGEQEQVVLSFDAGLCVGCGYCVARCPEQKNGAIAVQKKTDLTLLTRGRRHLYQDQIALCQECGGPIGTSRMLSRIASLLGSEGQGHLDQGLCPACRSASWL